MKSGVVCLYKEKGFTSHDAVAKLRRLYQTKKIGHTGTLDPQATGVLPILIGNAVKACDLMPEDRKTYCATVRFGIKTFTEDVWGEVLETDEKRPTREAFLSAMESFRGTYGQIPPMVSAVKVNGKKLYEYAREGKIIPREKRPVTVHSLELLSFSGEEATVRAEVSKGTYIRTLLWDICQKAGVIGAMSELEREKSAGFSLDFSVTLSEIEEMTPEERENLLLPTEHLFDPYPSLFLPAFFDRLIANGCAVSQKKIGSQFPVGKMLRLYRNGRFFALGKVVLEEGEEKIVAVKHFPSAEKEG